MNSKKKKLVVISSIVGIISILVVLVLLLVCFHNWKDATCLTPITCEKCGETQGEPLGHEWVEANCTEAKHCVKCNISEGEALGHTIKEMKTTKESSCSEEGERKGFCDRCQKDCIEKIDKLPHTKSDWKIKKDYVFNPDGSIETGIEIIECKVCKEELETREYTIELTLSQKNAIICAYDEISFWKCAPSYLIYEILVDSNQFSVSDAKLAVSHMDVDWDEQAVMYAKENCSGISKAQLDTQMRHYGFNNEQIEMALKKVGY